MRIGDLLQNSADLGSHLSDLRRKTPRLNDDCPLLGFGPTAVLVETFRVAGVIGFRRADACVPYPDTPLQAR